MLRNNLKILVLSNNNLSSYFGWGCFQKLEELYVDNHIFTKLSVEMLHLVQFNNLEQHNRKSTELPCESIDFNNLNVIEKAIEKLEKLSEKLNDKDYEPIKKALDFYYEIVDRLETCEKIDENLNKQLKELGYSILKAYLDKWSLADDVWQADARKTATDRILSAFQNDHPHLDLRRLDLVSLPECLGMLKELKVLDLSRNRFLSHIPSEIGQLKNLNHLDLSCNRLSSMPSEICQLKNLTHLDLSSNKLSSCSISEIGQVKNLNYLNLSGNRLYSLPKELGGIDGRLIS